MKNKNVKSQELIKLENFIDYNKDVKEEETAFKKLMFVYSLAIRELETKIGILKDEFKIFYNYDLIDHINSRVKTSDSIINKMKNKGYEITYRQMVENINDIAGVRVICPLKKDIFSVRNLIKKLPEINIIKEKDYITNPKPSGYSSYHMITEVPISLSQSLIYVKAEIQIRTLAMDFWANLEHKMSYKPEKDIDKKQQKEWRNCAKMIEKLDNKMIYLNS